MAIPTVQAVGSSAAGIGNITVTLPTHQADDILLVVHETNQSTAPAAPTNWAVLAQYAQGSNVTTVTVYWRRATASGTTNPTFVDPGNHQIGAALVIRGCITSGNPWDYTPSGEGQAGTTTFATTSQTTTVNDCLVFGVISDNTDTASDQMSGEANANLSSFTKRGAFYTTQGNGGGVIVYTGGLATAGSTGSFSGNIATTSAWAGVTFALKPAAGDFTGTVSSTVTAATTASGVVGKVGAASSTVTAATTAAGATEITGAVSSTVTASTTATGVASIPGDVSSTVTVATTAAGTVARFGDVSSTVTATTTAAGVNAVDGDVSSSVTVATTATGETSGEASSTVTIGTTAAGATDSGDFNGAATSTITATTTAAGVLGVVGDTSSTATVTTTAAGTVATFGDASETVTVTTTATGVLGLTGAVTATATVTTTAAGSTGITGGVSSTVTVTTTTTGTTAEAIDDLGTLVGRAPTSRFSGGAPGSHYTAAATPARYDGDAPANRWE